MDHWQQLDVEAPSLVLAQAFDGLWRGKSEPVLVAGLYLTRETSIRLVAREVYRFGPHSKLPGPAKRISGDPMRARLSNPEGLHALLLVAALEEDSGKDIQRVFGEFERHADMEVASHDHLEPHPSKLLEVTRARPWAHGARVELMCGGVMVGDRCTGDKWIGASAATFAVLYGNDDLRMNFLSRDEKNDWTARISVRTTPIRSATS